MGGVLRPVVIRLVTYIFGVLRHVIKPGIEQKILQNDPRDVVES